MAEEYFCCDDFDDAVVGVEGGSIDGGEFEVVVDEDRDPTTTAGRAVATQQGVAAKRHVSGRAELRLLYAGHLDIVLVEVDGEFALRRINSINVDL